MKKIGIGIVLFLLVIASVIFYMNDQEQKKRAVLNKLQEKVTLQLNQMQKNGFNITDRKIQQEQEHFFITIVEPDKASTYLTQFGLRVTQQEAEEFKGMKLSVDLQYFSNLYSMDIYPVTLPSYLKNTFTTQEDKNILAQLERMVKERVFFMHIDVDHSVTDFKGHVKDIDETVQAEQKARLQLEGFKFSGTIKEEKITTFKQSFDTLQMHTNQEVDISIFDLKNSYVHVGPTIYDYTSEYKIGEIESSETPEGKVIASDLTIYSVSKVTDGLATETLKANIGLVDLLYGEENIGMNTLMLDMNMSNLDVAALENLQNIDKTQSKEVDTAIETIIAKNIHLDISNFSVEKMKLHGKEMGGFTLHADLDVDRTFNIYSAQMKPKYALKKIDGDIFLSMSKELLNVIKEDPKMMLTYMMYRPKRELGQRLYHIKIGDGEIKINGKAVDF